MNRCAWDNTVYLGALSWVNFIPAFLEASQNIYSVARRVYIFDNSSGKFTILKLFAYR